ncbi:hypothetical protein GUITHDRAFT_100002 [Guillardia theta CCMP2712]|uniref:Uncharacterized protein n=1 Tax=Guillardia theta (strain CCMP2712) TaxID=905079 RepID=L1K247_GUITC|nr:hypothetical protein GUITHDRAFT_100002 [Guillardia theta CCMP2712]EKX54525.1 hypothetical protein GUITHDRAFT_100002 [Guillardia theta CCMP2712]|eukprot:XP_005841505.1 hypothetical protein GUITHDRAFT_100002 [Guillardia theta CCMP2712]
MNSTMELSQVVEETDKEEMDGGGQDRSNSLGQEEAQNEEADEGGGDRDEEEFDVEAEEKAEEEAERPSEPPKILRMQTIQPEDLSASYSANSNEELLVLEYVENFRRQFVQLYPHRKELLLSPRNECGVEKFICTTVRPTKMEYNEIYDLESCALFVSEHIKYEVRSFMARS